MAESQPLRFNLEVPADGRIEIQAPLLAGTNVTVLVTEQGRGEFGDLLEAAASSTDFWDNPHDEAWNNA